jgi:serine protease Do
MILSAPTLRFLAVVLLFSGLVISGNGTTAGETDPIWQEKAEASPPVLPRGYSPLPSIAGLVKQLKPAVVNVYTTQVIKPRRRRAPRRRDPFFEEFFGGADPFDRFFGIPRGEFKARSLGSGFIVSPDGYIVSNHHVVANATEIKVKLADERTFKAKVVGSDQKTDVALLKVNAKGRLPTVYLGDSNKLEVGDWVIAIGNPFGLGHTVTTGIISGKDRVIGHGPYDDFLQTDASINPGNSGGPLFDASGNVVGINTAIVAGGTGIGFAVPVNMAKQMLPQLRKSGKVSRGWLGVGIQDLTEELAENFGAKGKRGVLISQVFQGSPADKAGLKTGDVVLAVNGRRVKETRHLSRRIAALSPGSKAKLSVLRSGKQRSFTVKLAEREAGEVQARSGPTKEEPQAHLGLTLTPLTPAKARRLGVDEKLRGLVVMEVDRTGPTAGILKPGDVILEVNRTRITSIAGFRRVLAKSKGSQVLLLVQRGASQLFVIIQK